ncbi:ParB/RepB/Spo0J family partition protein [Candidatus Magnetaquicoccus inordinatus]|uniref:ParB/RepB/Spo0J family partition protein n=1 Tax=Candidatus Magnetaquicoccus inordinatus TaxID=2496818 RepID=UPI00102B1FA7|nr:ParB/RepB/Spo0J family partition protein [Candidatus Magnetaquicoccus inordinatus]
MSMETMTLGRGLGSLLGDAALMEAEQESIRHLPVEHIQPNPRQPRGDMDPVALEELAESIREQGILQPILVRPLGENGDRYELIAGERRWRAAAIAGLEKVPALIRAMDDSASLEVAILENVQREDLNPIEAARGYDLLMREFDYSHKKIGRRVGKSRMAITNLLRLLRLPEPVMNWVANGTLTTGHARALLGLEEQPERLIQLAEEIAVQGLSVRETEVLVRRERGEVADVSVPVNQNAPSKPVAGRGRHREPAIVEMESRLAATLGSKVTITQVRGKGKVILEYLSPSELESLVHRLLSEVAAS